MKLLFEACVENFVGAEEAQRKGADRIELCDNLAVGGTTPSYGTIKAVKDKLSIPQAVMIRARGGDFKYHENEKWIMLEDIYIAEKIGVESVVVGALKGNYLDYEFLGQARDAAKNSEIVCHMAFDETEDLYESLDMLIELGYNRVLTKGGSGSASANINVLRNLVEQAAGRITILAGGGVDLNNAQTIALETGIVELHGKKIV
ncbi:MAG: copper homeostasis protein CutC [Brevinemataceae bacterium]